MTHQSRGGYARAAVLSPAERKRIASNAARARWETVAFVNRIHRILSEAETRSPADTQMERAA